MAPCPTMQRAFFPPISCLEAAEIRDPSCLGRHQAHPRHDRRFQGYRRKGSCKSPVLVLNPFQVHFPKSLRDPYTMYTSFDIFSAASLSILVMSSQLYEIEKVGTPHSYVSFSQLQDLQARPDHLGHVGAEESGTPSTTMIDGLRRLATLLNGTLAASSGLSYRPWRWAIIGAAADRKTHWFGSIHDRCTEGFATNSPVPYRSRNPFSRAMVPEASLVMVKEEATTSPRRLACFSSGRAPFHKPPSQL